LIIVGSRHRVQDDVDQLERLCREWILSPGPGRGRCQDLVDTVPLQAYRLLNTIATSLREATSAVPDGFDPGNPEDSGNEINRQDALDWIARRERGAPVPEGRSVPLKTVLSKIVHGDPLWYEIAEGDLRVDIAEKTKDHAAGWMCVVRMSTLTERMRTALDPHESATV
jgi:hypothetical protein